MSKRVSTVVSSVVGDQTEDPKSEHISSDEDDERDQTSNDEYESRVHNEPISIPMRMVDTKTPSPLEGQDSNTKN